GKASLEVGGEVTIRVSKGKDQVTVPRVIGMTEDQAIKTLKDLGFEVLVEDQVSPDDGIVITQDPIPGFDAARGSRVTIYVGIAPQSD
ncbi:MAG: PASTA domain-containing protein, partial [Actinomycetota bacterium]|nr:PASTA domain-containing protein [Actinomycetota bacterium]